MKWLHRGGKAQARLFTAVIFLLALAASVGCASAGQSEPVSFRQITAEEAKQIMDTQSGYIVLDVRTRDEYGQGHIPGAVLLPNEEIGTDEIAQLPDKRQTILVYCRSGNRSKQAAEKLTALGYTNVYEFGGISNWPYEITQ